MVTMSFIALRRFAGFTLALMLLSLLCLTRSAMGQGTPLVTASGPAGLAHPTGWGTILQSAIDSNGDWFVGDWQYGGLYEFPVGGGAAITLAAPGSLGGYTNPNVLLDPGNNLYLTGNYNNCLLMFPYGSAANPYPGLTTTLTPSTGSSSYCYSNNGSKTETTGDFPDFAETGTYISFSPYYMQPWGVAIGAGPTANSLIIGNQQSSNQLIWSLPVTGAWTNPVAKTGSGTEFISGLLTRPNSIAVDPVGNIYFVEDSGGLPGVYEIPVSVVTAAIAAGGANGALSSDCPAYANGSTSPATGSSCLTRVDPNLPNVKGVITDAAGNLYISDGSEGVFMVPNPAGTPQTSSAVLIAPQPAQGEVALDSARNVLYVPTTQTQANGQADVAKVGIGYAEFGSSPVGTSVTTGSNVVFGFNGAVTPANYTIIEDGVAAPEFAITGGTCTTGVAYASGNSCIQNVSFTPHSVGNVSAKLLMLDAKNNILASMALHGTGMGANIQATPALQSTLGSGLMAPSQVATDALGNVYIADPGQGKVLKYAAGSSAAVSIGTGLTSPTGVAVDGAGDVFIADSSAGKVYEVPFGTTGLNAAGQVTLVSALGTSGLQLAADGLDNLYIADPSNGRVVKLSNISASTASNLGQAQTTLATGFTAPSAVATDAAGNVYVIDGVNLFELAGGLGTPVTLLNNLSGATGLAVDASGAIYISSASGTTRVPFVNGALNPGGETAIASTVSGTSSVALDRLANVYLTQAAGGAITVVSTNGTLTLSTPATLTSSTNATATITNTGNSALTVTGYTDSNPLNAQQPSYLQLPVDFTAADASSGGCEAGSPVAPGATCDVDVTFSPGAGEQGTVNGTVGVVSSAINVPTTISATGVALALSNSATNVTGGAKAAEVINTPLTITVAPKSGAGTPTGSVTITYTTWNVVIPSSGANAGIPTITPELATATSSLASGAASFTLSPVLAGTQTITVYYSGDRVYGRSTGTLSVNVAKSAITGIKVPTFPDPTDINLPFVPANTGGGTVPYDGSETPFQYNYIMKVGTAAGVPTGTITVMDNSTTCPAGTSAAGIGTASCILAGYATPGGYSGVACPTSSGAGVLTIENAGTATGAQASFPTSCLWYVPQGISYSPVMFTHSIYPVYSGDQNFLGLTGTTPQVLQSVRGPMLQITQTGNAASLTAAPSLTVQAGSSASMNLTLTSILGYGISGLNAQLNATNFPVSLTCDNLPPHTQCSFSYPNPDPLVPNSVDIPCPSGATTTQIANGSVSCTPGQVSVTFYTDVTAGTTTSQNARTTSVTLAAIFGFGMMGLFFRRKTFEKGRMMLMVLLMIVGGALAVSVTACNTTTLAPLATLNTPAGSYPVTITADEVGALCVSEPGGSGDNCIVPGSGSTSNNGIKVYGTQNQVSIPFYINVTVQ
jgi:sugar lactone lactonase YvrE